MSVGAGRLPASSAGVAHELRHPLAVILARVLLLHLDIKNGGFILSLPART